MSYAEQTIFKAIDQPLTPAQMEAADALSSRAVVTSHSARYIYHFGGGFRGDEKEMLTTGGFDAMAWEDSTGSFKLSFRIPNEFIDWKEIVPYFSGYEYGLIEMEAPLVGEGRILSFNLCEEVGDSVWLEENTSSLDILLPLRQSIISGDYRCLYLAWIKNQLVKDNDAFADPEEDRAIPAIPPGLGQADPALTAFCNQFYIYEDLIEEAVEKSSDLAAVDYEALLAALSADEKDNFLRSLLRGKSFVAERLRRRLTEK